MKKVRIGKPYLREKHGGVLIDVEEVSVHVAAKVLHGLNREEHEGTANIYTQQTQNNKPGRVRSIDR